MSRLLILGFGYCAARFVELYGARFDTILATTRSAGKAAAIEARGIDADVLSVGQTISPRLVAHAETATHVLVSVPPGEGGDPALIALGAALRQNRALSWIGYLSTTGIYGDHGGKWIDEGTAPNPQSPRARRRLAAENSWRELATGDRAVHIFRLSGIYGPGHNALLDLRNGEARRLRKAGQVFNRIHVDDIANVVAAAMDRPTSGPVFNLADDEPAPQDKVVAFAASLLGVEPPPVIDADEADMSEMARSFWAENKRVANNAVREELGVSLLYPTYREGLRALHECGEGVA